MNRSQLESARKHASHHRRAILASTQCGCFYCLATFAPVEISEWLAEENTALCPSCGIDSVIGDASGLPLSEQFLAQMQSHWF